MLTRSILFPLVSGCAAVLVTAASSCVSNGSGDQGSATAGRRSSTSDATGGAGGGTTDNGGATGGSGAILALGGGSGGGGQTSTARTGGAAAGSSSRGGSTANPAGGTRAPDAGSGKAVDASVATEDASLVDAGPLACADKTSNGRLGVYYYTGSPAAQTQDVQIHIDLINFTALSARLSQATVRYWFTDEDAAAANNLTVYYTPSAIGKITTKFLPVTPPREGADTVLEFSFTAAPDAGVTFVETTEFNFAFHKDGYSGTYDQSNDYSFDASLSKTLGPNPKITAYLSGALAWGCEPPPVTDRDAI